MLIGLIIKIKKNIHDENYNFIIKNTELRTS